jgi:hypothetical protein
MCTHVFFCLTSKIHGAKLRANLRWQAMAAKVATNWPCVCCAPNLPAPWWASRRMYKLVRVGAGLVQTTPATIELLVATFQPKEGMHLNKLALQTGWHCKQHNHQGLLFAALIVCCLNAHKPAPQSKQHKIPFVSPSSFEHLRLADFSKSYNR